MNTPVYDFLTEYSKSGIARLHMPGHKGVSVLGPEPFDITEIRGADALYEADGIIAESEKNASELFGTAGTVYSAEGSTQCVKAMLFIAARLSGQKRPLFLAARNAHKSFAYGAAFVDADVVWLYSADTDGLCSCVITPENLEEALRNLKDKGKTPAGVYITSPDYLGHMSDIAGLSEVAHRYGTLLLADNAHGAYLRFLERPLHPMVLGADMCCDSAHKTLPVLTGGAYLHVSKNAPKEAVSLMKTAMAAFGSTSPSYLIMASLDLCNSYLANGAKSGIEQAVALLSETKEKLKENGWRVPDTDPLRLTVDFRGIPRETADRIVKNIRTFEYEYYDGRFLTLMFTDKNKEQDFLLPVNVLGKAPEYGEYTAKKAVRAKKAVSLREGILLPSETVDTADSAGRICADPTVSCPPAVPVVFPGEEISPEAVAAMLEYGINTIRVIK